MDANLEGLSNWERWQESVGGRLEARLSGSREDFRGAIQRFKLLGLSYSSIETNARGLYRSCAPEPAISSHYCLIYQARGRSVARQGNGLAVLDPGDMVLMGPHETIEFVNKGIIRHLAFNIDEDVLQQALGADELPTMLTVRNESALGSLLSTLILQIHSRSSELATFLPSKKALDFALASLLAPLVKNRSPQDNDDEDMPDIISTLSVMRYVDANLRNANISPRYIAKAMGCSARHIHRAFDGTGTTVSSYIKGQRLKASASELRNPLCPQDSITEIAIRWGFSDISHFSRSFRNQFGLSPREYRDMPS